MRILADENFPGLSVQELRRLGHDVLWVRTAMPGARDDAILACAQTEERLLVTLDKDFGELAFGMRLPASCGVALFPYEDEGCKGCCYQDGEGIE